MSKKRAILFANGELKQRDWVLPYLQSSDTLIAVDGGLNFMQSLSLTPDLLIGDLDSVTSAQVEHLRTLNVQIRQYPPAKDETDLELALKAARELGSTVIIVVAALGKRLDQTLANISLLMLPELNDCTVTFFDGSDEVFLIRDRAEITGNAGDVVSLLPLWGAVPGVLTEGLAYPLKRETLYPERSRGISNVMTGSHASVSIESGSLLCIHTLSQETEKNEA